MTFDEYQQGAEKTAIFTHEYYPAASLMIESAELADLFTKPMLRGDKFPDDIRSKVVSEAGDVLWNLSAILTLNNITLGEVAEYNLAKLADRAKRGKLQGSGGDR